MAAAGSLRRREQPLASPPPGHLTKRGARSQGYGVYRFEDKYGANVDGYSPIYTPDQWAESGDTYKLGTKGLIAW